MLEEELNVSSLNERMKRAEKELEELRKKVNAHINKIKKENKEEHFMDVNFFDDGPPY